jgi:hypothetical protein
MRRSCGRRRALSYRWSWTVILVEAASSHELPVLQLPMIADSGRLARMLLFIPESVQVSGTSDDLADFCRVERGAQTIAGSRS